MANSQNGWVVIPAYGDARLGDLAAVEGSKNILAGDVQKVFTEFCREFAALVEPIDRTQSWGFAPRKVNGSTTLWSNHASGTAIDLNTALHPEFRDTYGAVQKAALRGILNRYPVIRWGGDYASADLDQMHFEIHATAPEVAAFAATLSSEEIPVAGMVSPVKAKVSSEYGPRGSGFHAGIDLSGQGVSRPVYASFAGTIERLVRGRRHGLPASVGPVWAKGRSSDGGLIRNPDGERQGYGHVLFDPRWAVGSRVAQGDRLGVTNLSGITTGLHLHYETWGVNGRTRNPRIYFNRFGIIPGSDPIVHSGGGDAVITTPGDAALQERLARLGYYNGLIDGVNGRVQRTAVRRYQQVQNEQGAANLIVDGAWGAVTEGWFGWTASAQAALDWFRGVLGSVVSDGDYGPGFNSQVRIVQQRNRLLVDGILGPVMVEWMQSKGSSIPDRP